MNDTRPPEAGPVARLVRMLTDKAFLLSALCLAVMVAPVVTDVLLRLTFHASLPGVIEIEEILMFLLVFPALARPQLHGGHIGVDLVVQHLSEGTRRVLDLFHGALCSAFTAAMLIYVVQNALDKRAVRECTAELSILTWPFYLVGGAALALLLLALLCRLGDAALLLFRQRRLVALALAPACAGLLCSLPWLLRNTPFAWSFGLTGGCALLLLLGLLLLGMPIGFAMGVTGMLGLMTLNPNILSPLHMLGISGPHTAMSYTLTVVPMFILMGEVALFSGISKDLFSTAAMWLGRLPGGLAIASVAGCAGFAAICGDSMATAMTMSSVALPEMKQRGYNSGLACACLAAGGTLGILIPPSIGFIFYAIITEESLGKLFLAGVAPGLLLAVVFSLMVYVLARFRPDLAPRGPAFSLREKWRSLTGVLPMLGLVLLVIGGILGGLFSPTEGGAVGAAGALVYAAAIGWMSRAGLLAALKSTVEMTAKLMFILIGVNILGYFLAVTRLPFELADMVLAVNGNRYVVLAMVVMLYVALGCVLNVVPMILLTLPAIFPTIQALGFDPVWFGVVTVLLMEMGQITPPMGIVVFAIAGMPEGAPMQRIFQFVLPFVAGMLLTVVLLTIFPGIALFLPSLLI